jgi:hypothetical protein
MNQQELQTNETKIYRIRIFIHFLSDVQLFGNRNQQTLKFYSRHYKELLFNSFYKSYYNLEVSLRLFLFHMSAFFRKVGIFNILHNSLVEKYYEYNVDKV